VLKEAAGLSVSKKRIRSPPKKTNIEDSATFLGRICSGTSHDTWRLGYTVDLGPRPELAFEAETGCLEAAEEEEEAAITTLRVSLE
jgi:hypothetical protein